MYTIGQLAKEFGLSRSALLYYGKEGLLPEESRTEGNYRLFDEEAREKLRKIVAFREAGVPVSDIRTLLEKESEEGVDILEKRLIEVNREIRSLRMQQKLIVEMLKEKGSETKMEHMSPATFTRILRSAGVSEGLISEFHENLEKCAPDYHQSLLEFLGLSEEEIRQIRKNSLTCL